MSTKKKEKRTHKVLSLDEIYMFHNENGGCQLNHRDSSFLYYVSQRIDLSNIEGQDYSLGQAINLTKPENAYRFEKVLRFSHYARGNVHLVDELLKGVKVPFKPDCVFPNKLENWRLLAARLFLLELCIKQTGFFNYKKLLANVKALANHLNKLNVYRSKEPLHYTGAQVEMMLNYLESKRFFQKARKRNSSFTFSASYYEGITHMDRLYYANVFHSAWSTMQSIERRQRDRTLRDLLVFLQNSLSKQRIALIMKELKKETSFKTHEPVTPLNRLRFAKRVFALLPYSATKKQLNEYGNKLKLKHTFSYFKKQVDQHFDEIFHKVYNLAYDEVTSKVKRRAYKACAVRGLLGREAQIKIMGPKKHSIQLCRPIGLKIIEFYEKTVSFVNDKFSFSCTHCNLKTWSTKKWLFSYRDTSYQFKQKDIVSFLVIANIDHIYPNMRFPNLPSNLRLICPNCHAISKTSQQTRFESLDVRVLPKNCTEEQINPKIDNFLTNEDIETNPSFQKFLESVKKLNRKPTLHEQRKLEDIQNLKHVQPNKVKPLLMRHGILKDYCSYCGLSSWEGIPFAVFGQMHHKSGNTTNNKFSNLESICPNCHTFIHKIRNIGFYNDVAWHPVYKENILDMFNYQDISNDYAFRSYLKWANTFSKYNFGPTEESFTVQKPTSNYYPWMDMNEWVYIKETKQYIQKL